MRHRGIAGAVAAIAVAAGAAACGEVDQRICVDVPTVQRAIEQTNIRPDFKQELLDDVAERANEANCPGFAGSGDSG